MSAPVEDAGSTSEDAPSEGATDGPAADLGAEASVVDGPAESAAVEVDAPALGIEAGDAAPVPACSSGELMCNGQCTAVATDTNNCGACGHSCAPGACLGGQCQSWVVVSAQPSSLFGCDGTEVAWAQLMVTDVLEAPADGSANHHSASWFQATPSPGSGQVYGVSVVAGVTAWTATDPAGNGNALLTGSARGAYGGVVKAGLGTPTGVALDSSGSNAYFGTFSGSQADIWQCSVVAGGSPCSSLTSFASSQLGSVVVDDSYVYWTDPGNGVVSRKSLTGGATSTLASGQAHAGALAVDAKNVYWTAAEPSRTVVRVMAKGATSFSTLAGNGAGITGVASDGTHLYLATPDGLVESIPASGGNANKLFAIAGAQAGYAAMTTLVYANGALFWNDLVHSQIDGLRVSAPTP
jgi:hypothetical protein